MGTSSGFGIDIGGSGIKGAPVELSTGELTDDRLRIDTPQPSEPGAVADVVATIVQKFGWDGPIGITLPCVVKEGVALTAANVDSRWLHVDARALFSERLGVPAERVVVLNDADAAGMAEMHSGAGLNRAGVVLLLTFGTGIGSALFLDGQLVPNTELGHIELSGVDAEETAAASVKDEQGLSWEVWAGQVNTYLLGLERLVHPDLFILGGGVSKKAEKWLPLLELDTEVQPAALKNNAGIVGAAAAAARGIAP